MKTINLSIIISFLCIAIFLIPNSVSLLGFSTQSFLKGEIWRIFSFHFAHFSFNHLLENVFGLMVVGFFGYELGIKDRIFFLVFFLSGISIALLQIPFFLPVILAGASAGIYAILGFLFARGSGFIPKFGFLLILLLAGSASFFSKLFSGYITLNDTFQLAFHFTGLFIGVLFFFSYKKIKQRKRIFT